MNILGIFFLFASLFSVQPNEWHGIIPLKSTRADVEKILGKPTFGSISPHAANYRTKTEKVHVLYSTGPCEIAPSNGWNIPEFKVISIHVYPDLGPSLADLKLDPHKFEKRPDPEIINETYYTNEKDGISITVMDGKVIRTSYFPQSKNDNLKCDKKK